MKEVQFAWYCNPVVSIVIPWWNQNLPQCHLHKPARVWSHLCSSHTPQPDLHRHTNTHNVCYITAACTNTRNVCYITAACTDTHNVCYITDTHTVCYITVAPTLYHSCTSTHNVCYITVALNTYAISQLHHNCIIPDTGISASMDFLDNCRRSKSVKKHTPLLRNIIIPYCRRIRRLRRGRYC